MGEHNASPGSRRRKRLAPRRKIHAFALVWMQMYKNYAYTPYEYFEDPIFVGDGLEELGFVLDCGESLRQRYPEINLGARGPEWNEILKTIDIQTLGNAIFSHWRYFNHWDPTPMSKDDFLWFEESFRKLADLTK